MIALVVSALATAGPAQAHHDPCGADGIVDYFVWDGSAGDTGSIQGDGIHWEDRYNWDKDCVPGVFGSGMHDGEGTGPYDDDVTIPAFNALGTPSNVVLDKDYESGGWQYVQALHNKGTVTVGQGTKLFVSKASQSKKLILEEGTLGGEGSFRVTKSLVWRSSTAGSSKQTTRDCTSTTENAALTDCSSPPTVFGRTIIARGATMTIDGRGVNLSDQRIIENHGTVILKNDGYIAADDGTAFRNIRDAGTTGTGLFQIENNGGYYQGFTAEYLAADQYHGPDWATVEVSKFTNSGTLIKAAGTGLSVIDADYRNTDPASPDTGTVEVRTGTISITTASDTTSDTDLVVARVRQGAGLGNGGPDNCNSVNDPASCAEIVPTGDDEQAASVTLPLTGTTTLRTVTIEEKPEEKQAAWLSAPVEIKTGTATATTTNPMKFRIFLDATLIQAKGQTADGVASNAPVYRKADGTTTSYAKLDPCASYGGPTTAKPACVDRTASKAETQALGSGDAVLVVRSLANSRYRVG